MVLWQPDLPEDEPITPGLLIRFTRFWLHYGTIAFVVGCTLIGAVRGILEH